MESPNKHILLMRVNIFLPILLYVIGCALTPDYVDLEYTSEKHPFKPLNADSVSIVIALADSRDIKDRIGSKMNMDGDDMAPILSNNSVPGLIKTAIRGELINRGFHISSNGVLINIELIKFYNQFNYASWSTIYAVSEVTMNIKVTNNREDVFYSEPINIRHTVKGVGSTGGKYCKMILDEALQMAVNRLMNDERFFDALFSSMRTQ